MVIIPDPWMGMFYTIKPSHGDDFPETFVTDEAVLDTMESHREIRLSHETISRNTSKRKKANAASL